MVSKLRERTPHTLYVGFAPSLYVIVSTLAVRALIYLMLLLCVRSSFFRMLHTYVWSDEARDTIKLNDKYVGLQGADAQETLRCKRE